MSLNTHSLFYYGFEVNADQMYFDFKEASAELTATLDIGSYTLTEFVAEVERAMNEAGSLAYDVSIDRVTRKITIEADGVFQLLTASGTHSGSGLFPIMGFSGVNKTGLSVYTGNLECGSVYAPQFVLQSYVSDEDSVSVSYGTVNKSASGKVEVVAFGEEKIFEMNIKYATDLAAGSDGPIRLNPNGVSDLRRFMRFLITKASLEFMPDENDPENYFVVSLESTQDDSKGLKFRLKEMYDRGLPGFFETGVIKLRRMD